MSYTASTRVIASSTGTDATLPVMSSGNPGLVPASGGGTTNFLRLMELLLSLPEAVAAAVPLIALMARREPLFLMRTTFRTQPRLTSSRPQGRLQNYQALKLEQLLISQEPRSRLLTNLKPTRTHIPTQKSQSF